MFGIRSRLEKTSVIFRELQCRRRAHAYPRPAFPAACLYAPKGAAVHFSIDDTIAIFCDLEREQYRSIFCHPKLAFCRFLHQKYGALFSFYCFYRWDDLHLSLDSIDDQYAAEFRANANWLKFGYHAATSDSYKNPDGKTEFDFYESINLKLQKITGGTSSVTHFVRGDRYFLQPKDIAAMHHIENGLCGLLGPVTADGPCYGLCEEEKARLFREQFFVDDAGVVYYPSHLCLDALKDDHSFYNALQRCCQVPYLICFSHEWAMDDPKVQKYWIWLAEYVRQVGRIYEYPEKRVLNFLQ